MNKKKSVITFISTVLMAVGLDLPATGFNFEPFEVDTYSTTISINGDSADIYFPVTSQTDSFPLALMLQGALVDKGDYTNFAAQVASYGFVVVVPNHERTLTGPMGEVTGFLAETSQVDDVLEYMVAENSNPDSPVNGIVDTEKLGLLGHSHGGAVGLSVIENSCLLFLCNEEFTRPEQLLAGAFYGTNRQDGNTGEFIPTDNDNIPVALVQGSLDGVATLEEGESTYELIQDSPKTLIIVEGANHYGITNEDNLVRDPIRPTLEQEIAVETISRWSGLFLRAHLLEDEAAFEYIYDNGDDLDLNVTVVSETQPIPEPTGTLGVLVFGAVGVGLVKRYK